MQIKRGSTRTAIIFRRYTIKIPSFYSWENFLFGLLGNIHENTFSKLCIPELCPVYFSLWGGFLNIMPTCDTFVRNPSFVYNTFINKYDHIVLPVEDKDSSFGYLRGCLVAIDYGSSF